MFNLFNFNFYVTIKYNWNVKYLRVLKGVNRFSKIIFFIFLKQNTIHTSSILMYCLYMNLKIVTNGVQDRFTTLAMPSDVLWGIPQHTHTCTPPHTYIFHSSPTVSRIIGGCLLNLHRFLPIVTMEGLHRILNMCMVELQNDKSESNSR